MMKKITVVLITFVALTLFSNRLYCQQDSSKTDRSRDQISNQKAQDEATIENLKNEKNTSREVAKDAQQAGRNASDAAKQSKSALKSEKKAQKARRKADEQSMKAVKARDKSDK
jgi:hypothetical protein